MAQRHSAPLMLLTAVVSGWVLLRGGYLALESAAEQQATPVADRWVSNRIAPLPRFSDAIGDRIVGITVPSPVATTTAPRAYARQPHGPALLTPMAQRSIAIMRSTASLPSVAKPASALRPDPNALILARMMASLRTGGHPAAGGYASAWPTLADERFLAAGAPPSTAATDRWSATAWMLARRGEAGGSLGLSGTALGGSQAGVRISWRTPLAPVSLFVRATGSPRRNTAAEGAVGVVVRPAARIPIDLVVERRVALAAGGRNAMAAYVVGGTSTELGDGWQLDSYGAAGVIGARRRDLFAETSVRLDRPLADAGRVRLRAGGGLWAAAQPGASRVDVGPAISAEVPGASGNPRAQIDWRERVTGNAAPDSGPALTLSVAF